MTSTDDRGPAVIFEDAAFTYDGAKFVFEDLNLEVPLGQRLALIGANGSGKSTIARCINALLVPDRGSVVVFGHRSDDERALYGIRSNAGMVLQNPDDQLVASVIENDVAFGPENLGLAPDEIARRVTSALTQVGLAGFERHETQALSGGQKQRVAIAGVLAMEPELLILDEASAMLDPRGRKGLGVLIRELHESGFTIIQVTHFMEEAAQAERVVALDEGRIVLDGSPREVFAATERLAALALEAPFAVRVSAALRAVGIPLPLCLTDEELTCAIKARYEAMSADIAAEGGVS